MEPDADTGSDGRPSGASTLRTSFVVLVLLGAALTGAFLIGRNRADWLRTVFEQSQQKSRLASSMQVNLWAATAAERSAVMAETDEAAKEFADASRSATAAVEGDRKALEQLIEASGRPDQIERLSAFDECWTRYQDIDREVLGLAGENTNLKALRLSFSAARQPLERMQSALDGLIVAAPDSAIVAKSAYRAMTAALKILSLHGRHIAEPRDEEMDRIEAQMKALDADVNEGLTALSAALGDAAKPAVDEARAAYGEFQKVNDEILKLSRRNSNVRSLALSLGQKRNVSAECEARLTAIQESLKNERVAATR
jgi:hypothetical protein